MLTIHALGWYRDKRDLLWMDAEPQADGNFLLYRSGLGPRLYTPTGQCLKDGDQPPNDDCHLAFEIERSVAPPKTNDTATQKE